MKYQVKYESIREGVIAEVSKLAASAYSDDGTSLYDGVMIFSSDFPRIDRSIGDGIQSIIARMPDITSPMETMEGYDIGLQFYVPDFAEANGPWVVDQLDRYLVMYAIAAWVQDHLTEKAPIYTNAAVANLDKAVMLLKTRKTPTVTINGD